MIRDRELHEMSRDAFMAKDRPRVFDRRANIKILRFWIVSRNKKETSWVLVVNTGRSEEPAGAGRFERVGQLSNLKRPEIIGNRHDLMFFQEIDHLGLATFIGFQERFLVGRNAGRASWIRIS